MKVAIGFNFVAIQMGRIGCLPLNPSPTRRGDRPKIHPKITQQGIEGEYPFPPDTTERGAPNYRPPQSYELVTCRYWDSSHAGQSLPMGIHGTVMSNHT